MGNYVIKGSFKAGTIGNVWKSFTKIVESNNEKNAIEKGYSLMGSEHGLSRGLIKIDEVKSVE
ncbi:MAG: 50S ribosomal protein L18Ae [Methanosaeta sp. PtaB.Bin039]|nr:MAG: 50S ribosomal protein L18Ae [Methanosaeta sp. PtaB.Bin039]OPY45480.1 MAG: 50S ribosomal protein L18Ae [Methanosaeta sp. PtaU1.Bin028]HOT07154.1 50S ribosomal protein L18Ae [Methanotrichaceae archaeon]HQF16875.1 50S ribosomal protein L18Ae [Methanotrichaceae archaeon]HQI91441.1 50S ribosomal protein L18Ae [Methanotrichaceae archaeon]